MKKTLNLLIIVMISFILLGCTKKEEDFDLTDLPYYEFIDDTNPVITIKVKGFGTMKAQLFPTVAENTVNNFIDYIEDKQFDKSAFHRIIAEFMIQGGIVSETKQPIKGEFLSNGFNNPLKHTKGVLSMARTSYVNSATSQFFIMHEVSPHLDGAYASFGGLISGFDVLDTIANVSTNSNDAPTQNIVIESIRIDLNGYVAKPVVYW